MKMTSIIELKPAPSDWSPDVDMRGLTPESWNCIDCGVNTAPGMSNRAQLETAFTIGKSARYSFDNQSEVYMVKAKVWKATNTEGMGGCLCIGCLEKRLGRFLRPKDFMRNHPFNSMPGTRRLQARREGLKEWVEKQRDGTYQYCQVGSDGEVTCVPCTREEDGYSISD
jgi:hypothetical protein